MPGLDNDADGIADGDDRCPDQPEDTDGHQDGDGCPDPSQVVQIVVVDEDGAMVEGVMLQIAGDGMEPMSSAQLELHPGVYTATALSFGGGFSPSEVAFEVAEAPEPERELRIILYKEAMGSGRITVSLPDGVGWEEVFLEVDGEPLVLEAGSALVDRIAVGSHQVVVRGPPELAIFNGTWEVVPAEPSDLEVALTPGLARISGDRITIDEPVQFESAEALVAEESGALLDQVAAILLAHPEITRLRIEGHTDSTGEEDINLWLSNERAKVVRNELVARGVAEGRLTAQGFGESKPIVQGVGEAVHAKNRRVEFVILD